MKKTIVIAALACTAIASTAAAQSLTTLFARNNGGAFGGAVYFDITIGPNALVITGYDTNTRELVTFGWEVFITAAGVSAFGNEQNPGAWTSVATGTGIGAGIDIPSPVTLNAPFNLAANTTYGMALVIGSNAGHDYTNGNGPNQSYSNADMSLFLGSANNTPFSASPFFPRVWNGTIYYIPAPSSLALLGLGGLVAFRRRR